MRRTIVFLAWFPLLAQAQFLGGNGRGDATGNTPCPAGNTISYSASSYCATSGPITPTITGDLPGTFRSTPGLALDAVTGEITPAASMGGTYVVAFTHPISGFCPGVSATTNVSIGAVATVNSPLSLCAGGTTAGLGASSPGLGTGSWSIMSGGSGTFLPNSNDPDATFSHLSGTGPVILRWTVVDPICGTTSADLSVIIETAPTPATVGGPQAICVGGTTQGLGGNVPGVGTGQWSVVGGGTGIFVPDNTTPNASFTHLTGTGPVVLQWTITLGGCTSSTTDTVTISPLATAQAGGPYSSSGPASVALAASANGPGMWSGGTGTFADANDPITTYTLGPGETGTSFTITWTTFAIAPCTDAASSTAQFVGGLYAGGNGRGDAFSTWPCADLTDSDGDGILDCVDSCPTLAGEQGDPCNDGDPTTVDDTIDGSCTCTGIPIPPNDLVCNAQVLTCGNSVAGTTLGASNSGTGEGDACGPPQSMPGVWYQVTGYGGLLTASLCNSAWDSRLSVYEGTCTSLVCVGGEDDNGPSCATAEGDASYAWMSNAGTTYYIKVHGYGSNSAFQLEVDCAPVNDEICNAIYPIACGSTTFGTTVGAGNTGVGEDDYCGTFQTSPGVWYLVYGTGDLFTASLCNTAWDSKISVYEGLCESPSCVGGIDDNGPACTTTSASYSWIAWTGTPYYIKVHGYDAVSDFELSLTCTPGNDEVCLATPITCGSTVLGSTIGTTNSGTGENDACGTAQTTPGVWYKVTGTGGQFTASLCNTAWDSKLSVYEGSCTALTCVGGIDDDGPSCPGTAASFAWPTAPGTTYYIKVHGYASDSDFELGLTCTPGNDAVCNAAAISCGGTVVGSTIGTTNGGTGENDACGTPQTQGGVWYQVSGTGGLFTASLCNTAWDSKISVYEGSCTTLTCVGGSDDNGPSCAGSAASHSWPSILGTTYFIKVHGYDTDSDFELSLTCGPPSSTCAAPVDLSIDWFSSIQVGGSWSNGGSPADDYYVELNDVSFGFPITVDAATFPGTSFQFTAVLDQNSDYEVCVTANCTGGGVSDPACITFTPNCGLGYWNDQGVCTICPPGSYCPDGVSAFPCPAGTTSEPGMAAAPFQCTPIIADNDLVCNALPVSCGSPKTGTTVGATMSGTGEGDVCGVSQTRPGVWYSIVGNGQLYRADLCGAAPWDSKISVYSGTCSALTCVVGNDDDGPACAGLSASVEWPSTVGEMYYIKVHGYNSESAFTLAVSCVDPPTAVSVAVKAALEGPYDATTGLMADGLRALAGFPLAQPYSAAPFLYAGPEAVDPAVLAITGNDAVVDWVLVELRDATTPATILATRAALLQRDGDVVDTDGTSPVGFGLAADNYHVAVLHRNHLGVMTAAPVALGGATALVDFTIPATATFGTDARKSVGGAVPVQALWAGDATSDGTIKYTGSDNDRDPILQAIGGVVPTAMVNGYLPTDVNLDGTVKYTGTGNDRDPILQNIGGVVPTNSRQEQLP